MIAALAAVVVMVFMAAFHLAAFADQPPPPSKGPSLWDYLFGSRLLFGASTFLVASMAALIVSRRWVSGFGRGGVKLDELENLEGFVEAVPEEVDDAREKIALLTAERDAAFALLDEVLGDQDALEQEDLAKPGPEAEPSD
jgi:hypothetical protein